ncbi:MAG: nucleotide sugar dehydrogenase [Planctomycetota bacterium]|nr:nucleotide sugar dehydrogenase [Planctomycetota bacterium]
MTSSQQALKQRLESREANVAVIGLGYVGLPIVHALHEAGYRVLGYDIDDAKIEMLKRGENYVKHLGNQMTQTLMASDRFEATTDPRRLGEADALLLCVPTPLGSHREPDLSYVLDSTRLVAKTLRPGQLVVLESTTYPGTTRDEMKPILEAGGLKCGTDFFLAYSPEREDPGSSDATMPTIPKLVGGIDEASGELATLLYQNVVVQVHRVETAEIAEAAKLLENIFRAVNIALVNELKVLFTEMDIDVWQVIEAASTKPFGFMPFYPGPGLGGHCIPIDPFYLSWKAREIGRQTKFIELAGEINATMPRYVIRRLSAALNEREQTLKGAKVLIIGIAYKPNVDDIRESPAAEIIELLKDAGAFVNYHDPHMPHFPGMRKYDIKLDSLDLTKENIEAHDAVLIVTNHDAIDYELIGKHAKLLVDTRNAMAGIEHILAPMIKA